MIMMILRFSLVDINEGHAASYVALTTDELMK